MIHILSCYGRNNELIAAVLYHGRECEPEAAIAGLKQAIRDVVAGKHSTIHLFGRDTGISLNLSRHTDWKESEWHYEDSITMFETLDAAERHLCTSRDAGR